MIFVGLITWYCGFKFGCWEGYLSARVWRTRVKLTNSFWGETVFEQHIHRGLEPWTIYNTTFVCMSVCGKTHPEFMLLRYVLRPKPKTWVIVNENRILIFGILFARTFLQAKTSRSLSESWAMKTCWCQKMQSELRLCLHDEWLVAPLAALKLVWLTRCFTLSH